MRLNAVVTAESRAVREDRQHRLNRGTALPSKRQPKKSPEEKTLPNPTGLIGPRLRLLGPPEILMPGQPQPHSLDPLSAALFAILILDGPQHRRNIVARLWPDSDSEDILHPLRNLRKSLRQKLGRECVKGVEVLELDDDVAHDLGSLTRDIRSKTTEEPPSQGKTRKSVSGEFLGLNRYDKSLVLRLWVDAHRQRQRAIQRLELQAEVRTLEAAGETDAAIELAEWMLLGEPQAEHAYLLIARLHWNRRDRDGVRAVIERCRAMMTARGLQLGPQMVELATLVEHMDLAPPGSAGSSLTAASLRAATRPVARSDVLRSLETALSRGVFVLLEGEPGIGKSCLLNELKIRRTGVLLVPAAKGDGDGNFELLRRAIRAAFPFCKSALPSTTLAELARIAPELHEQSQLPPYLPRLAEAVRELLTAAHAGGLRSLLLDDIQWADAASIELLLEAGRRLGKLGPSWLLACRSAMRPSALTESRAFIDNEVKVVLLHGLDQEGISKLLEHLGWSTCAALAWATALLPRTLGNPMFIREMLLAIGQQGAGFSLDGDPPLPDHWPVAESLKEAMQARLVRLSEPARSIAQVAAVAGEDFSLALTEAVLELDLSTLGAAWRELEAFQVLSDSRVAHDTLTEALYAELPIELVRRHHAHIAQFAESNEWTPGRIAKHWVQAEQHAKAAPWLVKAAELALATNRREDELALWDQAAHCHDIEGKGDLAFDARLHALKAATSCRQTSDCLTRAQALVSMARSTLQEIAALTGLVETHAAAQQPHKAEESVARLTELLSPEDSQSESSNAALAVKTAGLLALGSLLAMTANTEQALQMLNRAQALLSESTDQRMLMNHAGTAGWVMHYVGNEADGLKNYQRAMALGEFLDDWSECQVLAANMGAICAAQGRQLEAWKWLSRADSYRQRLGIDDGTSIVHALQAKGTLTARLGLYDESMADLDKAHGIAKASGMQGWLVSIENAQAISYWDLGQPDAARAALATPIEGLRTLVLLRKVLLAEFFLSDTQLIVEHLRAALEAHPGETLHLRATVLLRIVTWLAAPPHASEWTQLQSMANQSSGQAIRKHVDLRLALSHSQLGHHDEALRLLSAALDDIDAVRPYGIYFGEIWCIAHQVYRTAGQKEAALAAAQRGLSWVTEEALPHVPARFQTSFLQDNCFNAKLKDAVDSV